MSLQFAEEGSIFPPCFDVMTNAADVAFISSGIMSIFTAFTEVSFIGLSINPL